MEKEENAVQKDILRQLHWLLFCWCDKYKTKGSEREEVVIDYSFLREKVHHIEEAWHQQSMVAGAGSWEIISQPRTRSSEWTSSRTIYAISRPTPSGVLPLERLQPSKTFQTSSTENWVVTIPQPMGNIYHSVHHSSEAAVLEYWINVTYVCPKPSEVQLKWETYCELLTWGSNSVQA